MPSLAVSVRERSGTPDVSPSEYLEEMFIAALLLTGSAEVAEEAVLEGIESWDNGEAFGASVFHATLRAAIRIALQKGSPREREISSVRLPDELSRVLLLPTDLRYCFVMRFLIGLPRAECSQLLQLDVARLDERCASAALALASVKA
jgi:DNA-directed RNA polymerase specialized sigma24 family protein